MCSPFRSSGFERPLGRAAQPILLATFTIDVGVDALAEAGIYELLSRPLARCLRRGA
jgi:hypothetical protein